MLAMRKLLRDPSKNIAGDLSRPRLSIAYLVTLVANTTRIAVALRLRNRRNRLVESLSTSPHSRASSSTSDFCCCCLWSARASARSDASGLFRKFLFPLLVYYATTLGIPLANGAYRQGIRLLGTLAVRFADSVGNDSPSGRIPLLPVALSSVRNHSSKSVVENAKFVVRPSGGSLYLSLSRTTNFRLKAVRRTGIDAMIPATTAISACYLPVIR